ncbi:MAG: hypothetical protein L0332_16675 [Chloroflexi bacterium]|nr:hypothetical protein [Chloroflexota bacterium]MCI0579139.1 hypothetical protein [Chloroflexota bacterium]MCI0643356.1 hypothetical protein [Chloroflexota bacterium]MCI0728335.1 hypothetical protein [Chloroflexota bacterium]
MSTTTSSTPAGKTPQITKGAASLIFFYYGDSEQITLAQETMKLKRAMDGYACKVLLKHNVVPNFLDIREGDEKEADIKEAPTADNLVKYLIELGNDGYMIDLWIFSHGAPGAFVASQGQHGTVDMFGAGDVQARLGSAQTGLTQLPIRMIWSTLCYGASLNAAWTSVGAKVVAGAQDVNFYPTQFRGFSEEWNKGNVSYETALSRSDTAASRTATQVYLSTMDAPKTRQQWGGCPLGRTVLSQNDCAKDYFLKRWGIDAALVNGATNGREIMNLSSKKIITGDKTLTKNSTPAWG